MSTENGRTDFPTMPDATGGLERTIAPIMEARHLRKYFPLRGVKLFGPRNVVHAVEDTSLALYPGRALALVGGSGSGKTTIARILARLYEPPSRRILFRGNHGHHFLSLHHHRRHVHLSFQ